MYRELCDIEGGVYVLERTDDAEILAAIGPVEPDNAERLLRRGFAWEAGAHERIAARLRGLPSNAIRPHRPERYRRVRSGVEID